MFVETFSGAWGAEGAPCFCYTLYVLIGEVRNNMGTTKNRAKKNREVTPARCMHFPNIVYNILVLFTHRNQNNVFL